MRNLNRDKVRQFFWWAALAFVVMGTVVLCFTGPASIYG